MRVRVVFAGVPLAVLVAVGSCKNKVGLTSIPPEPERFIAFLNGAVVDSVLTRMRGGTAYVNVHTRVNGGEIRGQVFPLPQ